MESRHRKKKTRIALLYRSLCDGREGQTDENTLGGFYSLCKKHSAASYNEDGTVDEFGKLITSSERLDSVRKALTTDPANASLLREQDELEHKPWVLGHEGRVVPGEAPQVRLVISSLICHMTRQ